jgi:hypothetical protein
LSRWHASCSSRSGALSPPARHWRASSCVRQAESLGELTYSALPRGFSADCRLTIRGGGNRHVTWHRCRRREWGPPPRSFAADAHDCIMVRIRTDLPNTSLWREDAPQWRAPLGSLRRHSTVSSDPGASQKRPLAVHRPSACSGVKALRNTSDAKRQSRQALLSVSVP